MRSKIALLGMFHDQQEQDDPVRQRQQVLRVYAEFVSNAHQLHAHLARYIKTERLLTEASKRHSSVPGLSAYRAESVIFNTRLSALPYLIALCENTEEVQRVYTAAKQYNLPVRVRAGGHDHAGECTGDNVVLIDVSRLKGFNYSEDTEEVRVGAGHRFYELTPELAKHDRMIAHGTCATVGLTGFIQGGGWGPWTRKYGMCCEHLVGATVILGSGDKVEVSESHNEHILWALRGGGGMSYGLVTELVIKTFPLPEVIHRFELEWNCPKPASDCYLSPDPQHVTLDILKAWEQVIRSTHTSALLGTNLKINALPGTGDTDVFQLHHHCVMYGYWEGSQEALEAFIAAEFAGVPPGAIQIGPPEGSGTGDPNRKYNHALMGSWSRNSLADISRYLGQPGETGLLSGTPFAPDYDAPAPHKITSKLVGPDGLSQAGYRALLQTLTSDLLGPDNEQLGLFSYVTLGAIVGDYYARGHHKPVAFPYQSCLYTIQYQVWWNETIEQKKELQDNGVYVDTNRAMDWIDRARATTIEGAYGAFISFKDPAIPTEVYFQQNYDKLVEIKQECIQDPYNHLRTRKTII